MAVAAVAVAIATAACAMATIEFMELTNLQQYKVVQPLLIGFLKAGYKNVPDNGFALVDAMRKLAFEKGYTYQNVEDVAKEAAIRLGMNRPY
jgi:hypothetical protein